METAKRVMPFGQTGILRKVSVIKTSRQNLRHLRPDVRTVRATTDWSVKGPPSKKKTKNRLNVQKWYRCCQRSVLHKVEVSRKRCLLKGREMGEGRSHLTLTTRIRSCWVNLKLTRLLGPNDSGFGHLGFDWGTNCPSSLLPLVCLDKKPKEHQGKSSSSPSRPVNEHESKPPQTREQSNRPGNTCEETHLKNS